MDQFDSVVSILTSPYMPGPLLRGVVRAALDFNIACQAVPVAGKGEGSPQGGSFLAVEPEQVIVPALFLRGERTYARLWNCSELETHATVRAMHDIIVRVIDLHLQGPGEPLPGGQVPMRPWGVQTVEVGWIDLGRGRNG